MGKCSSQESAGAVGQGHSPSSSSASPSASPTPPSAPVGQDVTSALHALSLHLNAAARAAATLPLTSVLTLN